MGRGSIAGRDRVVIEMDEFLEADADADGGADEDEDVVDKNGR